jgi:nitroreductase
MNVHEAIRMKRAVRKFKEQALPKDEILAIVNAGRRAQSAKNWQQWRFMIVQEKDTLEKLSKLGEFAGHIAGAAACIIILTPEPESRFSVMFDAGQSASYMQLAAWELGIGSCLATIYEPDKARELLGFPEDYHARIAISFGYPAEEDALTRPPKKGGREALDNLIHWEKWQ